jgi:hypothetical protein
VDVCISKKTVVSVGKNAEKLESLYIAGSDAKWFSRFWKSFLFLKKLSIELKYSPVISLLDLPKDFKQVHTKNYTRIFM